MGGKGNVLESPLSTSTNTRTPSTKSSAGSTVRSINRSGVRSQGSEASPGDADVLEVSTDDVGVRAYVIGVRTDVVGVRACVIGVRTDVVEVRADVVGVSTDVTVVRTDVIGVSTEVVDEIVDQTIPAVQLVSLTYNSFYHVCPPISTIKHLLPTYLLLCLLGNITRKAQGRI